MECYSICSLLVLDSCLRGQRSRRRENHQSQLPNGMVSIPLETPRSIVYGNGWHPDGWHPMGAVPEMRTGRRLSTRITTSIPIMTSLA